MLHFRARHRSSTPMRSGHFDVEATTAHIPFRGEEHCGDQAAFWELDDQNVVLCMVDGLGHGEQAEEAALAAVEYVGAHLDEMPQQLFAGCNAAIGHTRGVAMAVGFIDERTMTMTYGGIGNTRAMIHNPNRRKIAHMSSDAGIIGGGYRNLVLETIDLMPGDMIVMSTDGLEELIDLNVYDQDVLVDINKLAHRLMLDWGRENDDRGVLIYRNGG